MSDPASPPPPGAPPPPSAESSWFAPPGYPPPPGPAAAYPPPAMPAPMPPAGYPTMLLAAAHKPGTIPIRPLGLGDIYDAAFKTIRFSPGATVGSAVLVTAVAMAIPILVTGILTTMFDLSLASVQNADTADLTGVLTAGGAVIGGTILQAIGLIYVTGMIAHVTSAAALGQKLSLGAAWAATAGKRLKLVGLSALLALVTVLYLAALVAAVFLIATFLSGGGAAVLIIAVTLAGICGLVFGWVRIYYLTVPPLMLEPIGVLAAIGRAWTLTSRQFWRTLGIALLTIIVTQIIGSILGVPFGLIGSIATSAAGDGQAGLILYITFQGLANVVSSAFVAPFTSSVTTLQYLDQRMRKEGFDVELLTRTGVGQR